MNERGALRVYVAGLRAGERQLDGEASHYLSRVHRSAAGTPFTAFDPEAALEASGLVTRIERGRVHCLIESPRPASNVGVLPVTLLQCAGKGDKLEEVIRAATALGVRRIAIAVSERSVARPAETRLSRWRSIAIDAARQSGRGDVPSVEGPEPLRSWLAALADSPELKLCLQPRAPTPLASWIGPAEASAAVTLLIGPEGGLADVELDAAQAAGFGLAALGPLTLRTELAALAALGYFVARLPGRSDTL
ncbi:MAG TPA: RsmE family RNA methyltransferase [Polyangiaceae bacterium]|nr:RsmE family RNA methyltransferase [Polyangiaceae bacterium]